LTLAIFIYHYLISWFIISCNTEKNLLKKKHQKTYFFCKAHMPLYWQTYSYFHMKHILFRNCYGIITKKLAVSFNHTFRYISMMSYQSTIIIFKLIVHLIYPGELEIKDTTESDKSASNLDIFTQYWLQWQTENFTIWQTWWIWLCNHQLSFSI
jgi:hypothetical protein